MSYIKINENDKKIILDDAENIPKTFIDPSDADITAADVAKDKIAYGADGKVIGTAELVTEGWYYTQDADITAEDVMSGKIGYGANGKVTGTYVPLDTTDADATAGDIREGKTAYVDGEKITGTGQMVESPNWFKVTNLDNSRNLMFYIKDASVSLSTSLDDGATWSGYINIIGNRSWTVPAGGTILFDGKINDIWVGRFDGDISYKVSGNLNTLLSDYPIRIGFSSLFENDTNLIDAGDLILPWKQVPRQAFYTMFRGCTSLTTAPALPGISVGQQAYDSMFEGCSSLTSAPDLPIKYSEGFYSLHAMFRYCSSLTTPPARLDIEEWQGTPFQEMFYGCSSLTSIPILPNYGANYTEQMFYGDMFNSCSSLQSIEFYLPCAWEGAGAMFANCTSLTSAHIKGDYIYSQYNIRDIFYGCSNLSFVQCDFSMCLNGEQLDPNSFERWLDGVAASGTLKVPASMASFYRDNNLVPAGWTLETF